MKCIFLFIFFPIIIFVVPVSIAQSPYRLSTQMLNEHEQETDSLSTDHFVTTVEQALALYYADYARKYGDNYEQIIEDLNYEDGQILDFSDDIYCQRLQEMDRKTPMNFDCNEATLATIRFFATKRRGFIRLVLGRSSLYFDMYEEKLAHYNLPLELKYLSVIESGLRPQVKSRAGALGLWQFMYRTGKMFGLEENSYIDERMNPEKATEAACQYFKHLYDIYGDWNLVLAAYNAGPGNVNKAIRRSGNKTSYWEIRPFLPRETQGYVPNFIAASYLLQYHAQHNIIPAENPIHYAQTDTICLTKAVHIKTIAMLLDYDIEDIKQLNPVYKSDFIPQTVPSQCLTLPIQHVGMLTQKEDELYLLEDSLYRKNEYVSKSENINTSVAGNTFYHKVKEGENIGSIAQQYNMTVNQIMAKNGLNSTTIYVGQQLIIENESKIAPRTTPQAKSNSAKYYTVKSGDTFGKIAQRHGKSMSQLKKLNPQINIDRLKLGQKIRVQ